MSLVLTRPSSPAPRDLDQQIPATTHDFLPSFTPPYLGSPFPSSHSLPLSPLPIDQDMGKEKPRLDISLDAQCLYLKGTGVDVEPTRLAGNLVLFLAEPTSLKDITLQFRGKTRLPAQRGDTSYISYTICSHDWSFLEGEKKRSHTLKAGRHFFPFQLELGGSLPSTISSPSLGFASVSYRLRAQATRSGLHHNLHADTPVTIMRSFTAEALEYQQTLEIENTWPGKLMYSIMIPHKAWAAGDRLTAVVKASPLSKGICVYNVTSSILETTKVHTRMGTQERTRIASRVSHDIVDGRAVEVTAPPPRSRGSSRPQTPDRASTPFSPSAEASTSSSSERPSLSTENSVVTASTAATSAPSSPVVRLASLSMSSASLADDYVQNDMSVDLQFQIPLSVTPTHALEPIVVSHRVRWSFLILNADGHTSELRCSLPVHLLDPRLLNEARSFTAATRRLLIGGEDPGSDEEELELPSYHAHVRDRVANMFLPDAATVRVANPWVVQGASPTLVPDSPVIHDQEVQHSGHVTPLEPRLDSHLPHLPGPSPVTVPHLDWVNSELLLSMSGDPRRLRDSTTLLLQQQEDDAHPSMSEPGHEIPPIRSNPRSRRTSRFPSRANSPDRSNSATGTSADADVHVHSGNASRDLPSVMSTTLKVSSTLAQPSWLLHTRSHNHQQPSQQQNHHHHNLFQQQYHLNNQTGVAPLSYFNSGHEPSQPSFSFLPLSLGPQSQPSVTTPPPRPLSQPPLAHAPTFETTNSVLLHRAFTEVPDYAISSRGFLGGVPPLTSVQGLPSYEEAEVGNRRRYSAPSADAHDAHIGGDEDRDRSLTRSPDQDEDRVNVIVNNSGVDAISTSALGGGDLVQVVGIAI